MWGGHGEGLATPFYGSLQLKNSTNHEQVSKKKKDRKITQATKIKGGSSHECGQGMEGEASDNKDRKS